MARRPATSYVVIQPHMRLVKSEGFDGQIFLVQDFFRRDRVGESLSFPLVPQMSARADVLTPIGTVVSGDPTALWSKRMWGVYFGTGVVPARITGKVCSGSSDLKLEVEWDVCGRKSRFSHPPGALQIVDCPRNRAATGSGGASDEEEGMEEDSSEDEEDVDSDPGDEDEEVVEPDDSAVDGVVKMKDGVEWRYMPDGVKLPSTRKVDMRLARKGVQTPMA